MKTATEDIKQIFKQTPVKIASGIYLILLFASFGFLLYDHYKYHGVSTPLWVEILSYIAISIVILACVLMFALVFHLGTMRQWSKVYKYKAGFAAMVGVGYLLAGTFWAYTKIAYNGDTDKMDHTTNVMAQVSMYYVIVVTAALSGAGGSGGFLI